MGGPEIIHIEIRAGVFVRIHGIPHDLTVAEAEKLARVVMAYATKPAQQRPPAE